MKIRAKYAARERIEATPIRPAEPYTFPAPVRGWVQDENLLQVTPGGATVLENWFCEQDDIRARGGCVEYADAGAAVKSLFAYRVAAGSKLFAATAGKIYDAGAASDAVTGLTSGDYVAVQFGTAGGDFLYAVNGSDEAQLYDGSSWQAVNAASTPYAITGVMTSTLSQAWSFGNRIWFVEAGGLSAWYLGVNSIAGAATEFSLAGVFDQGGGLLFGAKWSVDAGDGMDDKCVFVTTEGEVAVYEGTDPDNADTFRKAGLYKMPKPLGKRAYINAGGDLLIATESGIIPLSAVINTDMAALEGQAISRKIKPYWDAKVAEYGSSQSWELVKDQTAGVMMVSQPGTGGVIGGALAASLITGAWSRITGWDVQCLSEFGGRTYFGSANGKVYLADEGGSDDGEGYVATYVGQFDHMGAFGAQKTLLQGRAIVLTDAPGEVQVLGVADFDTSISAPLPGFLDRDAISLWDTAEWDVDVWDGREALTVKNLWQSVGVTGLTLAPVVRATFLGTGKPTLRLISTEMQFRAGQVVS